MVVFRAGAAASLTALEPARVVLLGGAPLDIEWNFVSSSKQRIERAKDDWRSGRFPRVPGDEWSSSRCLDAPKRAADSDARE